MQTLPRYPGILERYDAGEDLGDLAAEYRLTRKRLRLLLVATGRTVRLLPRPESSAGRTRRRELSDYPGLLDRYDAGETLKDLALSYRCSDTTLRRLLVEAGKAIRYRGESAKLKLSDLSKQQLLKRYDAGEPINRLAKSFGIGCGPVRRILIEFGRTIRGRGRVCRTLSDFPKLLERYDAGETVNELAAAYRISHWLVRKLLVAAGRTIRGRARTRPRRCR